jgi:DNA processing protein
MKIQHLDNITKHINLATCRSTSAPQKTHILSEYGIDKAVNICKVKSSDHSIRAIEWLSQSHNNNIITFSDPNYPRLLKQLYTPPIVLFCKGDITLMESKSIAIIGSRDASSYSINNTKYFTEYLSNEGYTIVSGLARGVDTMAGITALNNQAKTIAVIGNGIDVIYPKNNYKLQEEIANKGLLISEYPLRSPPLRHHFPKRNRIISGLARATLVIEAKEKSGSLITAQFSLEEGKEVFVIPGPIRNQSYYGSHKLIQDGATLVQHPVDIINQLSLISF